jgi:hypothetical protein
VIVGGNVFSELEPGYANRTCEALQLADEAAALDMGNVYEGGSIHGFSRGTSRLRRHTSQA